MKTIDDIISDEYMEECRASAKELYLAPLRASHGNEREAIRKLINDRAERMHKEGIHHHKLGLIRKLSNLKESK